MREHLNDFTALASVAEACLIMNQKVQKNDVLKILGVLY